MIKEEQNSDGKADRVGNLQDSKTAGNFSRHLKINLLKQPADIHICIKGHDGKSSSEKSSKADEKDFEPAKYSAGCRAFAVGKNEIGFSYMRNAEIRFFFLDHIDQIHGGHDILTGFHVRCPEDKYADAVPEYLYQAVNIKYHS